MSKSVTSLSPNQLKALKNGPTISVWWKATEQTEPGDMRIVCEALPKTVATTFSTVWNAAFPPINKIKVGDVGKMAGKKSVVVTGGSLETWKEIVACMVASCNGCGLAQLPIWDDKPYTHCFIFRACAYTIGCDHFVKAADKRMARIADGQIHSEDVRALWNLDPPDAELKKFLADHCAIRFFEKRLKTPGAYWTLREEIPELNTAINDFFIAKKAENKVQRAAERKIAFEEREKKREKYKKQKEERDKEWYASQGYQDWLLREEGRQRRAARDAARAEAQANGNVRHPTPNRNRRSSQHSYQHSSSTNSTKPTPEPQTVNGDVTLLMKTKHKKVMGKLDLAAAGIDPYRTK